MKKLNILLVLVVLFTFSSAFSLSVPNLEGRVNDLAGILSSGEKQILDTELKSVEENTSSQVAVLIISSLQGEILEDYSLKVSEQWKLGQKDYDNGVLLLISVNDKKLRIEVGYGLESILTDAKCNYIIRHDIVPSFRNGDYFGGILNGTKTITGIITQKFDISPEELRKFRKKKPRRKTHIPFGLIIFVIILILNIFRGGSGGRGGRSGLGRGLFWAMLLSGNGRSSSSGGFSSGGFGGFSGGGGSFGGGGSSGGW